jgi:predicted acetyltransferase
MKVELVLVKKEEKEVLRKLIFDYEKELLNTKNPGEYKYLDNYWEKENRFPYFIEVDNKIAGFVLVNGHTLVNKDGKNIAEFYVKKEFRKKGVGKMISFRVFDLFKGSWEVRQIKENILAQKFWKKVISEYTNNNYQEIILDDKNWCGFVQTFKN